MSATDSRVGHTGTPIITRFPVEGIQRDSTYVIGHRNAYDTYAKIGTSNTSHKLKGISCNIIIVYLVLQYYNKYNFFEYVYISLLQRRSRWL